MTHPSPTQSDLVEKLRALMSLRRRGRGKPTDAVSPTSVGNILAR